MTQLREAEGRYVAETPRMALELRADAERRGVTSLRAADTAGTAGQEPAGYGRELVRGRAYLLNVYRMLCTGRLMAIAHDEPVQASLEDDTLRIRWQPTEAHPVRLTAAYRIGAPDTVDVDFTVTAERDVPEYELLPSSYFDFSLEPYAIVPARPYQSGLDDLRLFRLEHNPFFQGYYVFLGRDLEAVRTRWDGRYQNTAGHPPAWFVSGPAYGLPVGVMGNETMHVVQVALRADCASITTTYVDTEAPRGEPKDGIARHNAVYFGLWASDIAAGETRTTCVRQVLRSGPPTLESIREIHDAFVAQKGQS